METFHPSLSKFYDRVAHGSALNGRGAMLSLALGVAYSALRLRLLPIGLMRAWFTLSVLITVFPASAMTYVLDALRYIGVPLRVTQTMCTFVMVAAFKLGCLLNPQIRTTITFDANDEDGKPSCTADIRRSGCAFVLNHTSFWDIYAFIGALPFSCMYHTRTLMKDSLRSIPIFGGCFDRVGHFPVFFKTDAEGRFEVDKVRQADVLQKVSLHLARGGNIAIFPEGSVNKTPSQLQAFRFGTFATIFEHQLPVYYMVMVGNDKTWPRNGMGGAPADIRIRFGAYPIDFTSQDSKVVAQQMRDFMQGIYDEMASSMESASQRSQPTSRTKFLNVTGVQGLSPQLSTS